MVESATMADWDADTEPILPPLPVLSERHLDACRASGIATGTVSLYRRVEGLYMAFSEELSRTEIRRWADHLRTRADLADSTIRLYLSIIKLWASWLEQEGYYDDSPLRKFKLPRVRQPVIEIFTPDQVQLLVRAAETWTHPKRDVAILYFLLDTMVRASELAILRTPPDLAAGWLTVLGKGRKQRRIHYEPETAAMLRDYLATRRDTQPWLFLGADGQQLRRGSLGKLIRVLGTRADIRGMRCSPHTFRHTGAVRFLQAHPQHIAQLRARLGHETLDMTLRYATRASEEMTLDGASALSISGLPLATE